MEKLALIVFSITSVCMVMHTSLKANETIQKEVVSTDASYNVCDIKHIYDEDFEYSLPKSVLQSFLSGRAFDHPRVYTAEESTRLREDINAIFQQILSTTPEKGNLAVMTAGAPGAGKTTKMRQDLREKAAAGYHFAYICPDDVCLKSQERTYQCEIKGQAATKEERQAAYNKWRPASNAATHLILGNLIREKYSFYFGTTSSSPATQHFFAFLKKQGYQIRLIHVTAPDDVRWGSIQERDKTFVQTTEQDVQLKGLLLPQRIMDTYLALADIIEFYYRDDVHKNADLAAIWTRNTPSNEVLGTLQIVSPSEYKHIKAIHNAAVTDLKRSDLLWEKTVEKHSDIIF